MPRSTLCARILMVSLVWLQAMLHTTGGDGAETQSQAAAHHEAKAKTAKASEPTTWPQTLRDSFGINFVLIPAGEFPMGSTEADVRDALRNFSHELKREWIDDEMPQHPVRISRAFYLSKYEITQSQWESVMGHNPSRFKHKQHPVENVSWREANDFICRLNARTHCAPYRLPTEAEWEYAARGSDGRRYPWGNVFEARRLNFCDRHCVYSWNDQSANDGHRGTAPVGSYADGVSPFGVYDMIGNVWEWVQDRYGRSPSGLAEDPTGPPSGEYRVMRGGSWDNNPGLCRAATRLHVSPEHRFDFVGLRLVRTHPSALGYMNVSTRLSFLISISCLILLVASIPLAQPPQPHEPSKPFPSSLGLPETVKAALQGAESAVAQVVVALAQVRSPVAMLKAKSSNPAAAEALLEEVEHLADLTMNVYQDAVLATADDAILASSAATQSVAILAQMRVNLTVAVAQLTVMQEAQDSGGGPDETTMAQAAAAKTRAFTHAAEARKQVEAAILASREIELSCDPGERQQALQVVLDAKRAVQAHAMAASAYVLVILAHATNQDQAVAASNEAAKATAELLNAIQNGPRDDQSRTTEEIQVAMARARLARAVLRIAMANSDITGVAAPDVALQATEVVQHRVRRGLSAGRRAAAATSPQAAHIIAVIARSDALAASVASRIVDAHVRLAIAQATEGTSNTAIAARLAAADQLQNAVALAREAEAEASLAAEAGATANLDTIHEAALRTESHVFLGAAWAQSATSWAYAAWARSQGLIEVAEAAEAAAIATESAATMVEATVGAVATSAPAAQDLPMDVSISSLALVTLSPSEVAAEVAEKAAQKAEEQAAETPVEPLPPSATNPLADQASTFDDTLRPSFSGVASPSR